ncbi:TNT domain-containing protein [Amycolatopsis jejuensis]|uniref:TNT domain-containing protein n=1 Tax=Amycolatopsis jejuensis TaxID=330084 RepID=UPI000B2D355A|nr:TNT domain-containing protein [Amycolatopsis jejuensis]
MSDQPHPADSDPARPDRDPARPDQAHADRSHPELAHTDLATGPVHVPAQYGGLLERGFDEVPTPPSGTGVLPEQSRRVGALPTDRESVLALFAVHMFPLGYLPVAADRPERQLPPADSVAEGVRCPPFDHPESALLDDRAVLGYVKQGYRRSPVPPADPEPPAAVAEGYEPPAGAEWERRFVAGAEYVWPPAQRFPEGGAEAPEPVVLPENTLLDRFGGDHGRVFAPDGTPFAERALPPAALRSGYRRYRVLKPMPVWQSTSAEWFGGPGGGIRYRTVLSADELVTLGFLVDVRRETR